MEKITSKSNSKIKFVSKLVSDTSLRKKEKLFVIEGLRLCCDALVSDVEIEEVYFTESVYSKHSDEITSVIDRARKSYEVTEDIFLKMSDTGSPQGVLCVCRYGKNVGTYEDILKNGKYIALENVQDPSNLGAVIRTAEALGIDGAVVSGGCDIYNPKALRASMGSLFRLPVYKAENIGDFLSFAKEIGLKTFTTTTDSNAQKITHMDCSHGAVCVIGNEGNGVTEKTAVMCDEAVTIPMLGRAQSLNASMAACITMWEMLR